MGLWHLAAATSGLSVTHARLGDIPVTVFAPADRVRAPAVVIAHGFAGSQQLMLPFAVTLARNGYVAVTFDFPGHAHNSAPLAAGFEDQDGFTRELTQTLGRVVEYARTLPMADGRLALLGHSMASAIVVGYAAQHPEVGSTVAVSLFFPAAMAAAPRDLLMIYGALEPAMLADQGFQLLAKAPGATGTPPRERVTYGSFADGSARRLALAPGVEHIGVLYSRDSLEESLDWLNRAFVHAGTGFVDVRGKWLGLLYLGLIGLAWPLAGLLPRLAARPRGAGLSWRQLLPVAIAPAVLTPLILRPLPIRFLPILLGDYLVLHFALYGLLTAIGLWLLRRRSGISPPGSVLIGGRRLALAALACSAFCVFAIGLPLDCYVTSFIPGAWRLPLILAMLCGTLPYFLADEWLTRGSGAARGGYAATKLCFLLSLVIAIALNVSELFFLVIAVPAILLLFFVYGLFSTWVYRRTGDPLVSAFANAAAFAWFVAVTFPIVRQ